MQIYTFFLNVLDILYTTAIKWLFVRFINKDKELSFVITKNIHFDEQT